MNAWTNGALISGYVAASIINFLPVVGVVSSAQLTRLYGVDIDDPALVLLMRHRAMLFGTVGALLLWAAFDPALRTVSGAMGLISMVGYIALFAASAVRSPELVRVFWVDVVGVVLLAGAFGLHLFATFTGESFVDGG